MQMEYYKTHYTSLSNKTTGYKNNNNLNDNNNMKIGVRE